MTSDDTTAFGTAEHAAEVTEGRHPGIRHDTGRAGSVPRPQSMSEPLGGRPIRDIPQA